MSFKTYKEILDEKGWADYEKQALLEEFTLNKLTEEIKENFDIVLPDSLLTALHTKDGNLVEKENPLNKNICRFCAALSGKGNQRRKRRRI